MKTRKILAHFHLYYLCSKSLFSAQKSIYALINNIQLIFICSFVALHYCSYLRHTREVKKDFFLTFCLLSQGPGASECTTCEAGHYCDSRTTSKAEMIGTKICPAGTHCPPGTLEKPDLHESTYACWKGHYCLRGDEVQLVGCHKPLISLNEMSFPWQSKNAVGDTVLGMFFFSCTAKLPTLYESIQVTL